jgi:hypothetical protein
MSSKRSGPRFLSHEARLATFKMISHQSDVPTTTLYLCEAEQGTLLGVQPSGPDSGADGVGGEEPLGGGCRGSLGSGSLLLQKDLQLHVQIGI